MSKKLFHQVLEGEGIPAPEIEIDSTYFTRWGHKKRYWAKAVGNGYVYGDYAEGISRRWFPHDGNGFTLEQKESANKACLEAKMAFEKKREKAVRKAKKDWESANEVTFHHYLFRKQVPAYGLRILNETSLLIPLYDFSGNLHSLQRINPAGIKRFLPNGRTKGCFHRIGEVKNKKHVFIAEGYATAASIHLATGETVFICFNVGNLIEVTKRLRAFYPEIRITIAADNDQWKARNVGKETAYEVARQYKCKVVLPKFTLVDGQPTDFNDLMILEGIEEVTHQLEKYYD